MICESIDLLGGKLTLEQREREEQRCPFNKTDTFGFCRCSNFRSHPKKISVLDCNSQIITNYQRDPYYPPPGYALPFPPPSYPSAPPPPPAGYEPFAPPPPQYQGYQSYLNQQYPPPPPSHYDCHHLQYHDDGTPGFTSFLEACLTALCCCCLLEDCFF